MLELLNNVCLTITDPLLGWMLYLPRDVALAIIAVGTAVVLTVVRLFTTNQDFLKRCKADKARLKELMREAKRKRDKDALARYRLTMSQIAMKSLRFELKAIGVSLIPFLLIATWAFSRIAYEPPQPGQPVTVKAYFTKPAIDHYVRLIPQSGLQADSAWYQTIKDDIDPKTNQSTNGVAEWLLRAEKSDEPYTLTFRYGNETFQAKMRVDGRRYDDLLTPYEGDTLQMAEVALPEYKPLGVLPDLMSICKWLGEFHVFKQIGQLLVKVPGLDLMNLPPWMLGYLIVVVPLSFLLKPLLRIY